MPTLIRFAAQEVTIRVSETAEQVLNAYESADGKPFQLELPDGAPVYINPEAVACWHVYNDQISPGRLISN
jgi:hypothetical protein